MSYHSEIVVSVLLPHYSCGGALRLQGFAQVCVYLSHFPKFVQSSLCHRNSYIKISIILETVQSSFCVSNSINLMTQLKIVIKMLEPLTKILKPFHIVRVPVMNKANVPTKPPEFVPTRPPNFNSTNQILSILLFNHPLVSFALVLALAILSAIIGS